MFINVSILYISMTYLNGGACRCDMKKLKLGRWLGHKGSMENQSKRRKGRASNYAWIVEWVGHGKTENNSIWCTQHVPLYALSRLWTAPNPFTTHMSEEWWLMILTNAFTKCPFVKVHASVSHSQFLATWS